jgi:hypothetical protein
MGRKFILGVILFLMSLTLTILHGSVVSKYIHNYQPSNQIRKVKIWQASEVKKKNITFINLQKKT